MKIYLKLKRNISILVVDGNWSLQPGDMIVFEKVGVRTEIRRNDYSPNQYIHNTSYLLSGFEYKTIKAFNSLEYHMVWNQCDSIDTIIEMSTGKPYYHTKRYNYNDIVLLGDSPILDNFVYDDFFEDVSIEYNRENKLKELLK